MKLLLGDCLQTLKSLEANTVDSVVTDPPYGLAFMGKRWDYDVPSVDVWREVFRVLKPGGHVLAFGGTRTYHRLVVNIEDAGFEIRDQLQWIYGSGFPKSHNLKGEWSGWGTALKPANEPIVLARKPLDGTVAQNVEKWGVGGLNIDDTRIEYASDADKKLGQSARPSRSKGMEFYSESGHDQFSRSDRSQIQGRWPSNVLLDEVAAKMLDEQSGVLKSGAMNGVYKNTIMKGEPGCRDGKAVHLKQEANSGGASRFFYVAKASKRERNAGLEGMPKKEAPKFDGGDFVRGKDNNAKDQKAENHHPTVKPIKLMQYLIKLITPPGGTVLDPFMGSGSTGVAAKNLGFEFIGCELNPEYLEIAEKRISSVSTQTTYRR